MSQNRILISLIFIIIIYIFNIQNVKAKVIKISFLLGDYTTKPLVKAKAQLKKELSKEILSQIKIKIFCQKYLNKEDLKFIQASRIIVISLMGRNILEAVKNDLKIALKHGAEIFGVYPEGVEKEILENFHIRIDPQICKYNRYGGIINYKNLILYILKEKLGLNVSYKPPVKIPEFAIYDWKTDRVFTSYEEFWKFKSKLEPLKKLKRPWVGIVFYKINYTSEQMEVIKTICKTLEKQGFNSLSAWGFPSYKVLTKFFIDKNGKSRIKVLIAISLKVGIIPQKTQKILKKLNIPVINAISLYSQTKKEWENSRSGLNIFERTWQIFNPELVGIIQPIIVSSKEIKTDPQTGEIFIEEVPIQERIDRLIARVKAWINLQEKSNKEKRIAIIYYNYPPGKHNIGASYLNVLPESLYLILKELKREGYDLGNEELNKEILFEKVLNYGRNIARWAPAEIEELVKKGNPVLIPIEIYKKWFEKLPIQFRKEVIKNWGTPEEAKIMSWKDSKGKKYLVIPVVRYGNIILTCQPARGWEQDLKKAYHDTKIPPHHQYIAFYLWLKRGFKVDAIIHLGTHGTHEWLPGKEVGFTAWDSPEILIQDIPNIYIYIVDDVGEGIQVKRRGMGVIIDHMAPFLASASLNPDLKKLINLIQDWELAKNKSFLLAQKKLEEITALSKKLGLLKDLGIKLEKNKFLSERDIEKIHTYLEDIENTLVPYGLHVFGKSPHKEEIEKSAYAMANLEDQLNKKEKQKLIEEYEKRIAISGKEEIKSLIKALSGKYIRPGQGNDPLRNPNSLPTGKNFYAFDPTKIPSPSVYELGKKLAQELIEKYKKKYGKYPDKLAFVLWACETIRHEGVMESEILYILGVKPKWNKRGKIIGLELIPREKLGRPRIDVVITASGLYRDVFPNLIQLLDSAINLVNSVKEKDNWVRIHTFQRKKFLEREGISEELANRLSKVRIFSEEPGSYGTNIDTIVSASHSWDNETKIANVYFSRMSFPFGQGFHGDRIYVKIKGGGKKNLNILLFKNNLSGTKIALHSLSTSVFGTLDNDDFFQYLGGLALAIRAIDKKNPEIYVTNLANPRKPRQETLTKAMGRELRSRYWNPEWIKAMLKEGYEGGRLISQIIENLWGWQVTIPQIVDSTKWQRMYEVYVLDKYKLNIKEKFKKGKNLWAYQALIARMLEAIRKGYWKPSKDVIQKLAEEMVETAEEIGLACCEHTCNNPLLEKFIVSILMSIPGGESQAKKFEKIWKSIKNIKFVTFKKHVKSNKAVFLKEKTAKNIDYEKAPGKEKTTREKKYKKVKGYKMEEVSFEEGPSSASIPYFYIIGFILFALVFLKGFRRKR